MKVDIEEGYSTTKNIVICDSNVWYHFEQEDFEEDIIDLTPTYLSLAEIASSEVMVHDLKLFQKAIKAVYEKGGGIIPLDPIDFVLKNYDPKFPVKKNNINQLLTDFSKILSLNLEDEIIIDEELKRKIIDGCKQARQSADEFAKMGNDNLKQIRRNINIGKEKQKHLTINNIDGIKEMVKSIFNYHVKNREYQIDFENFDWNQIELFITVTELYFKKAETTKDMKIKPNDAVDWLNMLYTKPGDKYLTFEKTWRNYIKNDSRISHYLYQNRKD